MNHSIPAPLSDFLDQTLASIPARRRAQMREELLAHLLAVFEEERGRLKDENAAADATLRRFGVAQELNQDLKASVPRADQIWHLLFRKEHLMRWVYLLLGVIGFFVGTGFICPALAQLLMIAGVTESDGLHHYGSFMIGLSITLLLFGCVLALAGIWSVVHGVKRFRVSA